MSCDLNTLTPTNNEITIVTVAINIDPEILIVDEALSVGDVFFQAKCYHKFEEFKKMGKTIIIVSHDLSSISKYCDKAILLNNGINLGEGALVHVGALVALHVGHATLVDEGEQHLLEAHVQLSEVVFEGTSLRI